MKTYYDLLGVGPSASAEEIKRAFRREIAKYHPDKVQHLGQEFQDMASGIAADLTEAYRILMDPELRSAYDVEQQGPDAPSLKTQRTASTPVATPAAEPVAATPPAQPAQPPVNRDAGADLVRRAAIAKVREAAAAAGADPGSATLFDAAFETAPRRGLFKKGDPGVQVLVRFVPHVDADAVADVWPAALKANRPDVQCVVLLMGSGRAAASELAAAVTEQRRRARGAGPVLVPVDVRDWDALFPPETPGLARTIIQRLRAGD